MNRFNRDYALIAANGQVVAESHNAARLDTLRGELADEGITVTVIKSDLARGRLS